MEEAVRRFEQITGRRPRILIAKMGQDGHDRWVAGLSVVLFGSGLSPCKCCSCDCYEPVQLVGLHAGALQCNAE